MASFTKFEDILAWQKAREVTILIYRVSGTADFSMDFGLKDQIRRASVSVMANIAEGHWRRTSIEFANFLSLARGSVAKVQSHLHVARGLSYIEDQSFRELYDRLTEISKMLLSLARYLRQSHDPKK